LLSCSDPFGGGVSDTFFCGGGVSFPSKSAKTAATTATDCRKRRLNRQGRQENGNCSSSQDFLFAAVQFEGRFLLQ
jgi:hypothetical protein